VTLKKLENCMEDSTDSSAPGKEKVGVELRGGADKSGGASVGRCKCYGSVQESSVEAVNAPKRRGMTCCQNRGGSRVSSEMKTTLIKGSRGNLGVASGRGRFRRQNATSQKSVSGHTEATFWGTKSEKK